MPECPFCGDPDGGYPHVCDGPQDNPDHPFAAKKYVPWKERLLWLLVPFGMAVGAFWFAAFFIWPLIDGIVTLALLFGGTIYLALFVWPYEEDHGW